MASGRSVSRPIRFGRGIISLLLVSELLIASLSGLGPHKRPRVRVRVKVRDDIRVRVRVRISVRVWVTYSISILIIYRGIRSRTCSHKSIPYNSISSTSFTAVLTIISNRTTDWVIEKISG
jgi:hypothetical protein